MKFLACFLLVICVSLAWGAPGTRIVGGDDAYEGQFPFAAFITIYTSNGVFNCGGALISNQYIITAAQCVSGARRFEITLGSIHLDSSDPNTLKVTATESIPHPDFDPNTYQNDLGLIRFDAPILFSDYIKSVDFLPVSRLQDESPIRALGWGQTNDTTGGPVNDLQWVMLASIANTECAQIYNGFEIANETVCVVGQNNEAGPCFGDIGSPIVQVVSLGHIVHVGISSLLKGDGCEGFLPSIYTRTFDYKDWIRATAGI